MGTAAVAGERGGGRRAAGGPGGLTRSFLHADVVAAVGAPVQQLRAVLAQVGREAAHRQVRAAARPARPEGGGAEDARHR